jgi:protein-S-isoprenylcysteine O-methyltransferase Ste14
MHPLFEYNPIDRDVWVASLIIWRVMEWIVDFRTRKRLRSGAQTNDRGSRIVLICSIGIGIVGGVSLALRLPSTAIATASGLVFWLGMLLIFAGMVLRYYAIHVLGAYFTTTVAIAPDQTLVDVGPYHRIRHPSYTGLLLIFLGLGLTLTNWLSLLVLMGCVLIGLGYRIRVEEAVLQEQLGAPYQEYMRRTNRLIPYVL